MHFGKSIFHPQQHKTEVSKFICYHLPTSCNYINIDNKFHMILLYIQSSFQVCTLTNQFLLSFPYEIKKFKHTMIESGFIHN